MLADAAVLVCEVSRLGFELYAKVVVSRSWKSWGEYGLSMSKWVAEKGCKSPASWPYKVP